MIGLTQLHALSHGVHTDTPLNIGLTQIPILSRGIHTDTRH